MTEVTGGSLKGWKSIEYLEIILGVKHFKYLFFFFFFFFFGGWLGRGHFILDFVLKEWLYF